MLAMRREYSEMKQSSSFVFKRILSCSERFQFLLIIIIIKLLLLKIKVRTVKFQIYEWQRATGSGADETRHWQWCVSLFFMKRVTGHPNPAQVRWRGDARFVYIRSKRATDIDVFYKNNETRH
jgi:hypothetical protein